MNAPSTLDNLRRIMDEMALWILEEQRDVPLTPETLLADLSIGADELTELLLACEETFGFDINELSEADYAALKTVGDIVALIDREVARCA